MESKFLFSVSDFHLQMGKTSVINPTIQGLVKNKDFYRLASAIKILKSSPTQELIRMFKVI